MGIIKLLLINWDSVLVVIVYVRVTLYLHKKSEMRVIESVLFRLVTEAEREYSCGTGELKKAVVLEWIYGRLPAVIKVILTENEIENLIEATLIYAKEKWATNLNLTNYIAGKL